MCWSAGEVLASLQLFFDTVIDFYFYFFYFGLYNCYCVASLFLSGTIYPQTALLHASVGQITQWASVPVVGTVGMHELALGLAW